MGTSNPGGKHSVNGREGDFGLVEVDQPGWTLSSNVAGQGGPPVTVTGSQEGLVGMSICRSGADQRLALRRDHPGRPDRGLRQRWSIEGLSFTNACSAPGDSGGSYVTQPNDPMAVGVHSGGGAATCGNVGGATLTIFQPVGEALAKWNLRLKTGA